MNRTELAEQVGTALGDYGDDYDIPGIVQAIWDAGDVASWGKLEDMGIDEFWHLIEEHFTPRDE